jgi:hypothetical protein
MTLQEIDAALMSMPLSPTEPADVAARAAMMQLRYDVEASARNAAANRAAAEKKSQWGLPLANVPPGIDTVITGAGRTVNVDLVDGNRVMKLTAGEVRALAVGNAAWTTLNPELTAQG